ncbi:MAG TPA: MFS transporter [Acidimicrobiales bacterium]|nr:MFS transporter [Acidimicrobiales bacterium]
MPTDPKAAYLRRMMWLLLPAAFFTGFDGSLRAILLPDIQRYFHVGVGTIGVAAIPITAGQFLAFFVIRTADRFGRRPLLIVSLLGYTLFTGLTAAAPGIPEFVGFQFAAQVFIGTEYAMAVLVVSEEFDPAVRGRALGRLLVAGPAGSVAAAVLLGLHLDHSHLGWRAFYIVGLLPLVVVIALRPFLHETHAFEASATGRPVAAKATGRERWAGFVGVWRRPYAGRVGALGAVSFLQKIAANAGTGWWVFYAERERHYSTTLVAIFLVFAYGLGITGYYACGRLIDRWGRKPTTVVYLTLGIGLGATLFQVGNKPASFGLLLGAVFFALGVGPALSAFGAEMFPTEVRAQASGWVGNGFANAGAVLGQSLVGILGDKHGLIGSVGDSVTVLTLVALPAIPVVWWLLPETRGTQLDEGDPLSTLGQDQLVPPGLSPPTRG